MVCREEGLRHLHISSIEWQLAGGRASLFFLVHGPAASIPSLCDGWPMSSVRVNYPDVFRLSAEQPDKALERSRPSYDGWADLARTGEERCCVLSVYTTSSIVRFWLAVRFAGK